MEKVYSPIEDERPLEKLSYKELRILLKALKNKARAQGHTFEHENWCEACQNITVVRRMIRAKKKVR